MMLVRQQAGRRRRARRDRGVPRQARKRASSSWSTASTCCRSPRARTTSACCDGDQGPNTGGMGAYSPAPVVTPELHARVMREIIQPDGRRHGGGRHPLHRLPLRRPDDRRARATRRCSNSTAGWATRRRSRSCMRLKSDLVRAGRARDRRHARPRRGRVGPPRRARRGAGRRRLSRTTRARATRSRGLPQGRRRTSTSSTPAPRLEDGKRRHQRRPRAVRHRARRHA